MEAFSLLQRYQEFLAQRGKQHRSLRNIAKQQGKFITIEEQDLLNFTSNDYLGIASSKSPQMGSYSSHNASGAGASRLISGNLDIYTKLENQLAGLHGVESALFFASGYQLNTSCLAALLDSKILQAEPLIFTDRLIHASLHAGIKLSGAKQIRFRHNDLNHLNDLMHKHCDGMRPVFIITESVFSMDGDGPDLAELVKLKKKFQAFLYLDTAHDVGVSGENGKGLAYQYRNDIDAMIVSAGKSLGASGAYILTSAILRDYLINTAGGFIYSTAPSPLLAEVILQNLEILKNAETARQELHAVCEYLHQSILEAGWQTNDCPSHITPIVIGDDGKTLAIQQHLIHAHQIYVAAIRPPTVPSGTARLRISLTALHNKSDVDRLMHALKSAILEQ